MKRIALVLTIGLAVLATTGCGSFLNGLKNSGAEVKLGFLGAEVAVGFHGRDIVSSTIEPANYVLDATGLKKTPLDAPAAAPAPVAADPPAAAGAGK